MSSNFCKCDLDLPATDEPAENVAGSSVEIGGEEGLRFEFAFEVSDEKPADRHRRARRSAIPHGRAGGDFDETIGSAVPETDTVALPRNFAILDDGGQLFQRFTFDRSPAAAFALVRWKGKRSAQLLTKVRILLKADVSDTGAGWSDNRIAAALDTSIATIERTRRQLVEEGLEAVLARKYNPNSARPRIFDGAAEAKLIALTLSPAPEGFARWSLRLLEEKVVELHIVERASDNTIGRTLKKTFSNRIASSNG